MLRHARGGARHLCLPMWKMPCCACPHGRGGDVQLPAPQRVPSRSVRRVHGIMLLSMTQPLAAAQQALPYLLPSVATEAVLRWAARASLCCLAGRRSKEGCAAAAPAGRAGCTVYRPALAWAWQGRPLCAHPGPPAPLPCVRSGDWRLPLMAVGRALQGLVVFYAGCRAEASAGAAWRFARCWPALRLLLRMCRGLNTFALPRPARRRCWPSGRPCRRPQQCSRQWRPHR